MQLMYFTEILLLSAHSPSTLVHLFRLGVGVRIPSRYKSSCGFSSHSRKAICTSCFL